ncbi:MAG: translocation/assembly module TamB domain-containing protein [Cocleimonas sp.]
MNIKKNIKPLAIIITVGLASASFSPVKAGGVGSLLDVKYDKPWYFGVGLGKTKLEPRVTTPGGFVDNNKSQGYKVYGGYKVNNTLAFEAFYTDLGAAHIDIITNSSDVDYQAYGAGLTVGLPLTKRLSLQGKVGYGGLENKVKAGLAYEQVNENMVYTGLGLEYRINRKLSWRAEYDYFDKDYQMLSGGLQFHF